MRRDGEVSDRAPQRVLRCHLLATVVVEANSKHGQGYTADEAERRHLAEME